jgi:hypothetical protein
VTFSLYSAHANLTVKCNFTHRNQPAAFAHAVAPLVAYGHATDDKRSR